MAIEHWMPTLASNMAEVIGDGQVHDYSELPPSIEVWPTLIIVPVRGSQTLSEKGPQIAVHQLQMTLYIAAQVLPEAYSMAVPYIVRFRDRMSQMLQLGGLNWPTGRVADCMPVGPPEDWYEGPGGIGYAGKEHLGIRFRLLVKEVETFIGQI